MHCIVLPFPTDSAFVTGRNLHVMFSLLLIELIEKEAPLCSFFRDYIERGKVKLSDGDNMGTVVV